jgi:hypothetical protein
LAQYQILAGIDPTVLRSGHMRRGDAPDDEQADHRERHRQPRRPWFLIAACLTLVVLSWVLWVKWTGYQKETRRLQRELTRVYKEAEDLRMQATLGQERIARLERELRALRAESQARPAEDKKGGRSAPKR